MRNSLAAVCLVLVSSCGGSNVQECDTQTECTQGGITGTCEASCTGSGKSYCAYPAPVDCPASGLKFGVLAGEGLDKMCVMTCGAVDAGVDAAAADAAVGDASLDAGSTLSSKIIVAAYDSNSLFLYNAESLAAMGTFPLTDLPSFVGLRWAGTHDSAIWLGTSDDRLLAVDADTLVARPGFPAAFDPMTTCDVKFARFHAGTTVCSRSGTVYGWAGEPPIQVGSYVLGGSVSSLGVSRAHVMASYGSNLVAMLDLVTFAPVVGSPVSPGFMARTMVADEDLGRLAIATDGEIRLYDQASLTPLGSVTFPSGEYLDLGLFFDVARGRLIANVATSMGSFLAAYSASDLSVEIPLTMISAAPYAAQRPVLDASRDRIYAVAQPLFSGEARLLVIEAGTLEHAVGSPILLPDNAGGLTFF